MSYHPPTPAFNADYRLALQLQAGAERQASIPSPQKSWSLQGMSDEEYAQFLQRQENDKVFANSKQPVPGQYPPYIAPPGSQGTGGGFSHAPISPPLSPSSSQPPSVQPPPEPQPPQPPQPQPPSTTQGNPWAQQPPTILPPPSPPGSASNTSSGYFPAMLNPMFYNYPEPQIPLPSSTMAIPSDKKWLTVGQRCCFGKSVTGIVCWRGVYSPANSSDSGKRRCGAGRHRWNCYADLQGFQGQSFPPTPMIDQSGASQVKSF